MIINYKVKSNSINFSRSPQILTLRRREMLKKLARKRKSFSKINITFFDYIFGVFGGEGVDETTTALIICLINNFVESWVF